MRWLAFGTYDVDAHPRVAVLLEGLADHGEQVEEIVEPLDLPTAARVQLVRQPWRIGPVVVRLASRWARLVRRSWPVLVADPGPDAVLVGYLGLVDVLLLRALLSLSSLRRRTARRAGGRPRVVLDHLVSAAGTAHDRDLARSGGLRDRALRGLDALALAAADVVVVDTDERRGELPDSAQHKVVVVPVGATHAWLDAGATRPDTVAEDRPLSVVFVGLFTPLQGTETIGRALAQLAPELDAGSITVTLAGRGQDHTSTRALAGEQPGLTWLDWVPAVDLPGLVAGHDVGLGIFGTTTKARSVVPTKAFQAAAAGCALVTSGTTPQRRLLGAAATYVTPGDPQALATALIRLAGDRHLTQRLGRAASAEAHQSFTPYVVVQPLLEHLR